MKEFIIENLQILSTLGSALAVYIFIRTAAKKDVKEVKEELKELRKDVHRLDSRVSRIEGRLMGISPPSFEPKILHKGNRK